MAALTKIIEAAVHDGASLREKDLQKIVRNVYRFYFPTSNENSN